MAQIVFTLHAREQMQERQIAEEEVQVVLESPDAIVRETDRTVYQKIFVEGSKRYLLRVITTEEEGRVRVITLYRTTKIAKYLP